MTKFFSDKIDLLERHSWIGDVGLQVFNLPSIIVSSEKRDGTDFESCCEELQLYKKNSSNRDSLFYLLVAEIITEHSTIAVRRRGYISASFNEQQKNALKWYVEIPENQIGGISHGIACFDVNDIALFERELLGKASVLVDLCGLTKEGACDWMSQDFDQIWKIVGDQAQPFVEKFFLYFPNSNLSTVSFYGSEDFGGVFLLCYGDYTLNLKHPL